MIAIRYVRVSAYLLWRAFQAMVVIPAIVAGGLWLVAALAGQAPTHDLLTSLYQVAETDVRPAAPGHVFQEKCLQPQRATPDVRPALPITCSSSVRWQVPVEEAIEHATATLTAFYIVLVVVSFGALVFFIPGRRFAGLVEREPVAVHGI